MSCPLDAQAEQIVIKLDGFFKWAKNDPKIRGFNPWHFNNRSNPQLPGWWDQRLGASSMPSVVLKLREIGQFIIHNEERMKWYKIICSNIFNLVVLIIIYFIYLTYKKERNGGQTETNIDKKYEVLS